MPDYCAIDFGTSNSAVAIPDGLGGTRLVELEGAFTTMPTAVFYAPDGPVATTRHYGRAAIAAYVDGIEGRLMRSMKSILGSDLAQRSTDIGGGHAVKYLDVVAGYLHHLKRRAEAELGAPIAQAVLGRPVYFVDDDALRDAQAQRVLEAAARAVGLAEISFQYEPIAAAFDYEQTVQREQIVLVCDIGGGTSDFSVVRVGPRADAASNARTTSSPTTACTSPEPTSTAASSSTASSASSATAASVRRCRARRRARCPAPCTSTWRPGT